MEELFTEYEFDMIIDYCLKIKYDIKVLKEIKSDLINSALNENRNLDCFEIHFLGFLEKSIDDKKKILNRFYDHIKTENSNEEK